jgi:hypothetical protein
MPSDLMQKLAQLYAEMETSYVAIARRVGLTCTDCPDNCCSSYFQHHTHIEWAYLWEGLHQLPEAQLQNIRSRAGEYVLEANRMLAAHTAPNLMCPLNTKGQCSLYTHRLMICRLHGVPNCFTLPNGLIKKFPGCFRCQELVAHHDHPPMLERTQFYRCLAALEVDFIRGLPEKPPKVRLTLAQMIHQGPPR